ncbi:MAG: gliding motility-associated C-terminal domain-containing protein [Crocinitomicaceae bacterium]
MDKFEKLIKKTVDSYEAPYSEAAWAAMSDKLGPEKGGFAGWIAGATITAAAIIFGVWYLMPDEVAKNSLVVEDQTKTIHTDAQITITDLANTNESVDISDENSNEIATITETASTATVTTTSTEVKDNSTSDDNIVPAIEMQMNLMPVQDGNELKKIDAKDETIDNDIVIAEKEADFSKFNLQAVADRLNLCVGEEVNLSPSIPKLKADYEWVLDGRTLASGPYAKHTFDRPGNYLVSLNLLNKKSKKVVNKSESITINVAALPQNEIAYEFDNTLSPTVNFTQKNTFYKSINWDLKGLYQTSNESFSFSFKNKGSYVVACKLTDENGCQSESTSVVTIENNYNLLAPSAFTPNGDNLNETFIPKALLITSSPFIMTIYDKSGKLVFETNEASRPWDGLYTRDLTPAPGGSYVWIVQLTNEQNMVETYQGQVTITR